MKCYLLLALAVFVVACESPNASRQRAEWPETVELARVRVLDQLPSLDSASREMILTNAPKVQYVGAPFGGTHTFVWQISSNRLATLDAYGSPSNVESGLARIQECVATPY